MTPLSQEQRERFTWVLKEFLANQPRGRPHTFAVITLAQSQVPEKMWCPTSLIVNGEERHFPVPEPSLPLNFPNGTGLRYEAEEVRQCLLKGTVVF